MCIAIALGLAGAGIASSNGRNPLWGLVAPAIFMGLNIAVVIGTRDSTLGVVAGLVAGGLWLAVQSVMLTRAPVDWDALDEH